MSFICSSMLAISVAVMTQEPGAATQVTASCAKGRAGLHYGYDGPEALYAR